MLGVFLLPAFTRLGPECQDLFSPCGPTKTAKARTRDAASRRIASPTHYRLSYSGPLLFTYFYLFFLFNFAF